MLQKFIDLSNKIYLILMSIALVILTLTTIFVWIRDGVLVVPLWSIFWDLSPFIAIMFFSIYVKGIYDISSYFIKKKTRP